MTQELDTQKIKLKNLQNSFYSCFFILFLYNWFMSKIIFVTGGSASGKTTIAKNIKEALGEDAILISQDMFYIPTKSDDTNYDIPSAFDWKLQNEVFKKIQNGESVEIPIYCFEKHDRIGTTKIQSHDIIIFEGLFTFWDDELIEKADFQIFVDTPSDTRLARRLIRDVKERGRDPLQVINRWQNDVQPSFLKYINEMRSKADIIVPWIKVREKTLSALIFAIRGI